MPAPKSRKKPSERPRHTSIIYFHGMGTPRRYEELSRVLDTLDRYAETQDPAKAGMLRGQEVGFEPSRLGGDDPVAFLRFNRFLKTSQSDTPDTTKGAGRYRLYESYWSPAAAGGVSPLAVILWVLSRIVTPFDVLLSPWRAHMRLKNTFLHRMFFDRKRVPALHYQRLSAAYRKFEGMGARRQRPKGRFDDFIRLIQDEYPATEERAVLIDLAKRWRRAIWRSQVEVTLVALAVIAILASAASLIIFLGAYIATLLGLDRPLLDRLVINGGSLHPAFALAGAGMLALMGYKIADFLRLFLSDVVFWTTTLEKDVRYQKRREILAASEEVVRHVLADPDCDRIVILAHSLGTAIAYETMLRLGRRLKAKRADEQVGPVAEDAMRKISHFITLGSPIDRISYFFQLSFSRYHRFNRVFDTMLGSTADLPFQDDRKPLVQWINIRDPADPISSRLFSSRGALPNRDDIQEVEVSSSHFPEPAGAHTGYFDSTLGAKVLFDACVLGRRSIQLQDDRPSWSKSKAKIVRAMARVLAAVLVTGLGLGAFAYWTGSVKLLLICQAVVLLSMAAMIATRRWGGALDRRYSLKLPA